MRVVSFDVGHTNMAMVVADVDDVTFEVTVLYTRMTNLKYLRCRDPDCMFERTDRRTGHLVMHYVDSIDEHLREADYVLCELQPIMGMVDVEQCLGIYIRQRYAAGRPRFMRTLAPNSMHRHFGMSGDKVERRVEIVNITERYLAGNRAFDTATEKDHLGDACGYELFFVEALLPGELRTHPFEKFKFSITE